MVGVVAGRQVGHARISARVFLRLCAAFIVGDIAAAIIGLVLIDGPTTTHEQPRAGERPAPVTHHPPAAPAAAPGAAAARAVSWVRSELPKSQPVLADPTVSAALAEQGFHPVGADAVAAFVVSTPALRADAKQTQGIARTLDDSVPVAVLGSGPDAIEIRQVAAVTPAQLAADARTRRSAENELLSNPAITTSPAAAPVLRQGALDLRSATFLAIAASTDHIRLVRINVDPAEEAAGRPARSVVIRTSSSDRLRALLQNASVDYRVASAHQQSDGSWLLTWPVDVVPRS